MRLTLQTAMDRRRVSIDMLADRSGINRATLYRLQSGFIADPRCSTVRKLEQALGLRPGSLVFPACDGLEAVR